MYYQSVRRRTRNRPVDVNTLSTCSGQKIVRRAHILQALRAPAIRHEEEHTAGTAPEPRKRSVVFKHFWAIWIQRAEPEVVDHSIQHVHLHLGIKQDARRTRILAVHDDGVS